MEAINRPSAQNNRPFWPIFLMVWVLLFAWIAWAFQPSPSKKIPPIDSVAQLSPGSRPVADMSPRSLAGEEKTYRTKLQKDPGQEESQDTRRPMTLPDLPKPLYARTMSILSAISNALESEGMARLSADGVTISIEDAKELDRQYDMISKKLLVFDEMLEEKMQSIISSGGPGTGEINVSSWDRVSHKSVIKVIEQRLGKIAPPKRAGNSMAHNIVRWNRLGDRVRFGLFKKGTNGALDAVRADFDQYYNTTARRTLIKMADYFQRIH